MNISIIKGSAEMNTNDPTMPSVESLQEQVDKASSFMSRAGEYLKNAVPLLIAAVLILVVGILLTKLVGLLVKKSLSRSKIDGAARGFLVSLIKIILYAVVCIMALSVLNVPMSTIITLFGAAGLAVSLALQNCLANLCGGFILLFSKPFSAGDTVELDGIVGKVSTIGILYTKVITFDNKSVFIPNGKITDAKIINYTESPTRRLELTFDISYSSDLSKAKALIHSIVGEESMILNNPAPVIRLSQCRESSQAIDVLVWVRNDDYFTARYFLVEAVKESFDRNGIVIPFNQLDVHIVSNTAEE